MNFSSIFGDLNAPMAHNGVSLKKSFEMCPATDAFKSACQAAEDYGKGNASTLDLGIPGPNFDAILKN